MSSYESATPEERATDDKKILSVRTARKAAKIVSYAGPLVALVNLFVEPSVSSGVLLGLHVVLLLLFGRLALMRQGDAWGRVHEMGARKGLLPDAVVRLFDPKYGKLLLAKVTKGDGRYAFLVGEGEYSLTASKQSYVFPKGAKTVRGGSDEHVSEDLGMRREGDGLPANEENEV